MQTAANHALAVPCAPSHAEVGTSTLEGVAVVTTPSLSCHLGAGQLVAIDAASVASS
jgi:hypothetical protein